VARHGPLLLVLLLAIVPLLPTLAHPFVFDDHALLASGDPTLRERVAEDLFGRDELGRPASGYYRPLIGFTYWLERRLFGTDPTLPHAVNIGVHAAGSGLLLTVLASIPATAPLALPAAAIFAAHPVHAESLAPITGRTDPFAALFLLLAARALLARRLLQGALAFACALASKESAVALAPLLALAPLVHRTANEPSGSRRTAWTTAIVLGLLGAAFFAFKHLVLGISAPDDVYRGEGDLRVRLLTFVAALPTYLGLLALPLELSIARVFPLVVSIADPRFLSGLAMLVVACGLLASRAHALAIGAALLLLPLAPASNIVPITYSFEWMPFPFFERYLYLSVAGYAVLLAAFTRAAALAIAPRHAARFAMLALLVLAAAYAFRLERRVHDFESDERLFATAVAHSGDSSTPRIQAALGRALDRNDFLGAIAELDAVISAEPENRTAIVERATLAAAFAQQHLAVADSLAASDRAAEAAPVRADALRWLEEARTGLEALDRGRARDGRVVEVLALIAGLEGDPFRAARLMLEASELPGTTSEFATNHERIAQRVQSACRDSAAGGARNVHATIELYKRSLEALTGAFPPERIPPTIRARVLQMWAETADQLVLGGRGEEARAQYLALLEAHPGMSRAHEGLGFVAKQFGDRERAYREYETALRLDPEAIHALLDMETMLLEDGRREEAARYRQRIIKVYEKSGFQPPRQGR
jgi:tetratricopeptide (TPR) repeat protein